MKAKPARSRRPHWITQNKLLLALHHLGDEDGRIVAEVRAIACAAQIDSRSVDHALKRLEADQQIYFVSRWPHPYRVILTGSPAGEVFAADLMKARKLCEVQTAVPHNKNTR